MVRSLVCVFLIIWLVALCVVMLGEAAMSYDEARAAPSVCADPTSQSRAPCSGLSPASMTAGSMQPG